MTSIFTIKAKYSVPGKRRKKGNSRPHLRLHPSRLLTGKRR